MRWRVPCAAAGATPTNAQTTNRAARISIDGPPFGRFDHRIQKTEAVNERGAGGGDLPRSESEAQAGAMSQSPFGAVEVLGRSRSCHEAWQPPHVPSLSCVLRSKSLASWRSCSC